MKISHIVGNMLAEHQGAIAQDALVELVHQFQHSLFVIVHGLLTVEINTWFLCEIR